MLNSFFGKIVAVLTSFFLAVAAFFGLGEAMLDYAEKDGETVDNYEIPIRIAYAPGFTEEQFPVSVDK